MQLPWFLQGPNAQITANFATMFWQKTNQAWFKSLKQRFSVESTPTALELQALQLSLFVKKMNNQERQNLLARKQLVLGKLGTTKVLPVIKPIFALAVWRFEVMHSHPMASKYPNVALRFWYRPNNLNQDLEALEQRIKNLLLFFLPAKNTRHFQLIFEHANPGFGNIPFGEGFGV